jgi:hypothetical protein
VFGLAIHLPDLNQRLYILAGAADIPCDFILHWDPELRQSARALRFRSPSVPQLLVSLHAGVERWKMLTLHMCEHSPLDDTTLRDVAVYAAKELVREQKHPADWLVLRPDPYASSASATHSVSNRLNTNRLRIRTCCIREDKSKHTVSIRPSPPDPFTDRHEHNHVFENSTPTYSVYKQGILFASVRCCIRLSTEKLVGAPQPIISARKR